VKLRVEFYRDSAGEFRWRAQAANNKVVADSAEGYTNKGDCVAIAHALFEGVHLVEFVDNTDA